MSGDNVQKRPLVTTLNDWEDDKNQSVQDLLGRSIPAEVVSVDATGTIVTVKFNVLDDVVQFPQVECAVVTNEYTRAPIRAGTQGMVVTSQLYLGGVTGLGGGNATLDQLPNMSSLAFIPLGNTGFQDTDDPNWYVLYGPEGVLIRTEDGTTSLLLKKDGGVMVEAPLGHNILGANLVEAVDDPDARGKGIPTYGFYHTPDGTVKMVRP